mmetsp:Transcript_6059/g.10431  ORF Transcript_6059/g.10431 Transcript_6059/m.10431 type:complete len:101 (-) Transcript_6059:1453-1755(-)
MKEAIKSSFKEGMKRKHGRSNNYNDKTNQIWQLRENHVLCAERTCFFSEHFLPFICEGKHDGATAIIQKPYTNTKEPDETKNLIEGCSGSGCKMYDVVAC